jgi:hypothetical protein
LWLILVLAEALGRLLKLVHVGKRDWLASTKIDSVKVCIMGTGSLGS